MYFQQLFEYLFYRDVTTTKEVSATPWYGTFKKPDGYKNTNSSSVIYT